MERDMNLLRSLLILIEEKHDGSNVLNYKQIKVEGFEPAFVRYHAKLLFDSKLVDGFTPMGQSARGQFSIGGLTSKGHDYLEIIRNDEVWEKTEKEVKEKKIPQTLDYIAKVAGKFVGAMIGEINS